MGNKIIMANPKV